MALKHLLVHLDGSARASARLGLAARLAARFGAHLTALFAEQQEALELRGRRRPGPGFGGAADAARAAFEGATRKARVSTEWWQIPDGEFDVAGIAARYVRYADLAVVGQHDPDDAHVPARFVEPLVLESGRPVLVVPSAGEFRDVGRQVVIAWDGGRETARALNDALPLFGRGCSATIALMRGRRDRVALDDAATPSVLRHLRAHGVRADYEILVVDRNSGLDPLGAVLNLGAELGADLVVMGAQGTHGTPFPRATRRTRASLSAMTAPVLFAS